MIKKPTPSQLSLALLTSALGFASLSAQAQTPPTGPRPAGFKTCSAENQRCNFNGAASVVYGAGNVWTLSRSFTNGVDCGNSVFGDPVFATVKSCLVKAESSTPTPGGLAISSFTVVNADSDKDISTFTNSGTISLATAKRINVRANAGSAASVVFTEGGATSAESAAPFSLKGDTNGDYNAWSPKPGTYTITAKPFDEAGKAGMPATLKLTVVADGGGGGGGGGGGASANLKYLAPFPIGAGVSLSDSVNFNLLKNSSEKRVVEKHFSQLTAGNIMKVSYLHPSRWTFNFTEADAFNAYAKSKNITIHGHALVWHADYQIPGFMKDWNESSSEFLKMLDYHVITIVDHFQAAGNVVSWDVVNEAIDDGNPAKFRTDSVFYKKSGNSAVYIERAFKAARLADPAVTLYYNDYNIEQNNSKTNKLVEMLTDFKNRGIPIDGVGFQMHIAMDYPSIANIKAAMKRVADKGLKVKITELDIAINNPYSPGWSLATATKYNSTSAGAQKKRYCEVVEAYMAVVPPAQRGGISVWGTTDANTWLTDFTQQYRGQALAWPLLFDNSYNEKPALRGFADGLLGNACTNN